MTICPSGAAPTVSGPGAASTRPARVRGAFAGPGVPRGPIVATRTPCPPGQSAEALPHHRAGAGGVFGAVAGEDHVRRPAGRAGAEGRGRRPVASAFGAGGGADAHRQPWPGDRDREQGGEPQLSSERRAQELDRALPRALRVRLVICAQPIEVVEEGVPGPVVVVERDVDARVAYL